MDFREIKFQSSEYEQELKLRHQILRQPLGLSIDDDPTHLEGTEVHLGLFEGNHLIASLILKPLHTDTVDEYVLKMRQVAVASGYQGQGLGKQLIQEAEKHALGLGATSIELSARETVIGFYQSLGYECVGQKFKEVGINHQKMTKSLD